MKSLGPSFWLYFIKICFFNWR